MNIIFSLVYFDWLLKSGDGLGVFFVFFLNFQLLQHVLENEKHMFV